MATWVVMPRLGYTMTEGMIEKWFKKEGDLVEKDDLLVSIMTDKVSYEYQSPGSGILRKILHGDNEMVAVSAPIAILGTADEDITTLIPMGKEISQKIEAPQAEIESERSSPEREKIFASPVVKKMAQEHHLDLRTVAGTGPGGKIMKEDVLKVVEGKGGPPAPMGVLSYEIIPVVGIRKIMGERMGESKKNYPHFYLSLEVDMTHLLELRNEVLDRIEKERGIRVSLTDLLVKIVAHALMKHPWLNSTFETGHIKRFKEINISVAMAGKDGLIVPVVHGADRLSLGEISLRMKGLNQKVQNGALSLDDVTGGTFTLSNLGMFGIDQFTAIINPPQCAILALGRVTRKPAVIGEQIGIRPMAWTTLSADHRILDGKQGAEFLTEIKELVENPKLMLV